VLPAPLLSVSYNPTTKIAALTISGETSTSTVVASYELYNNTYVLLSGPYESPMNAVNIQCIADTVYNFRARLINSVGTSLFSNLITLTAS
jgi:hypothetical protein